MKYLALLFLFFLANNAAHSQSDRHWPSVEYEGKMLQLRWEPAGRDIKVFVTGFEAAAVKFNDLEIEASVGLGDKKKYFLVDRQKDHFFVRKDASAKSFNLKLKIKGEDAGEEKVSLP